MKVKLSLALGLVPFFILRFVGMDRVMESAIQFLERTNWLIFIPVTILLYIGLMFLAVTLRKKRPT